MTLSLALLTEDYVIAVTDRRITSGKRLVTEEHDKTFSLFTNDARLAVSFSGLAGSAGFLTHHFLVTETQAAGAPDFTANGVAERLCDRLTETFRVHSDLKGLSKNEQRLSVMFAGYRYAPEPIGIYAIISNFENPRLKTSQAEASSVFSVFRGTLGDHPVTIGVGNLNGVSPIDMVELRTSTGTLAPRASTFRMVAAIRRAADHTYSQGTVGKQLTSILIRPDITEGVSSDYHVAKTRRGSVMPSVVWAMSDQQAVISNISIKPVEPSTPPMSVPKVGRNKRCPCGSGKKYKYCHGAR